MYEANVLADSVAYPSGVRLTTLEVIFPRFILAEMNTHRMFSRNSASSRAIPTERLLDAVYHNPFIPIFNERVKGMGVGAELEKNAQEEARQAWLEARDDALAAATELMDIGVDKSRANRLLEPFLWHTCIISATEWSNFFALRAPEGEEVDLDFGAQPEIQEVAILMRKALQESTPKELEPGQWHLPLVDWDTQCELGVEDSKKVAVGLLARRSSYNRKDPEAPELSINRHNRLLESKHWSPFEHVATPMNLFYTDEIPFSGNFRGWRQYRKTFAGEQDAGLTTLEV